MNRWLLYIVLGCTWFFCGKFSPKDLLTLVVLEDQNMQVRRIGPEDSGFVSSSLSISDLLRSGLEGFSALDKVGGAQLIKDKNERDWILNIPAVKLEETIGYGQAVLLIPVKLTAGMEIDISRVRQPGNNYVYLAFFNPFDFRLSADIIGTDSLQTESKDAARYYLLIQNSDILPLKVGNRVVFTFKAKAGDRVEQFNLTLQAIR